MSYKDAIYFIRRNINMKIFKNNSVYRFYIHTKNMIMGLWKLWVSNCDKRNFENYSANMQLAGNIDLNPQNVSLEDHTRIQTGTRIISHNGKVIVKKFTAISAGCTIIPGAHIPTVGLPQFLSITHINDKDGCIVINEDVWVAANVTLLSHCNIGRGAIVAAGAVVSKNVPPYAVVAGIPAKIIGIRFSIDQILQHESSLYPKEERYTREQLEQIFHENFEGKKSIGKSEISEVDQVRLAAAKQYYGIKDYTTTNQTQE